MEQSPQPGGTLRLLHEAPLTLDPVLVDDVYEATVVNQIYEGLVRLDESLSLTPSLAESWVVSEDGRLYRFTLRAGVRFHNGQPLVATTVVESLERALSPDKKTPCLAESYLQAVVGARDYERGRADRVRGLRAPDDRTVEIELVEPLSFFLSVFCMDQTRIVPTGDPLVLKSLNEHPVGTGPFRFVHRLQDKSVVLTRAEDYWGAPSLVDSLIFRAAPRVNPETAVALMLRHRVDGAPISHSHRTLLEDTAGFRILPSHELSVTFLGLNTHHPPLDRLEVRQAIAHCVDRQALEQRRGLRGVSATGVLPPGLPGYEPKPKVIPFDPERAEVLLRSIGITPETPCPTVTLLTGSTSLASEWLETDLKPRLGRMGIPIEIKILSWAELDPKLMNGTAAFFTLSWVADVPDPDSFLYLLFRSGESNNLFAFSDSEVDSSLDQARRMPQGSERFNVYREVEARVLSLAPLVPLYHEATLYAWDPSLKGVEANPLGIALMPFARVWFQRTPGGKPDLAGKVR